MTCLERAVRKGEREAPGKKTAAGIETLKEILNHNGGSRAFTQIQDDLGPSQFSQLVNKLSQSAECRI